MIDFNVEVSIDKEPILKALGDNLEEYKDYALSIVKDACPVDTGTMRNSITATIEGLQLSIDVHTDYAPYTEYRTNWFSRTINTLREEIDRLWGSSS